MSGLASVAVYLAAALMGGLGLLWVLAKVFQLSATRAIGIAFLAVSALCVGYLSIEKFVGVHYTKGFYMAVALMVVVGFGTGIALRRR